MTLTINITGDNHFASVETEGGWNPQNGITNSSLRDLTQSIFENKRYEILEVETLKDRIIIKYEDKGVPSVFVFNPKSDYSKTFIEPHMPLAMNKLQNAFDRVEFQTVAAMPQIRLAVQDTRNIQVLWLRGHGTPTSVTFGDDEVDGALTIDNVEKYLDVFERVDKNTGIIFLDSCCDGDTNLTAEKIHRLTGRKVCANEHSYGFKGRVYLVRGEDNQFRLQSYGDDGKNITTIFQNNQRMKYNQNQLELIKAQGYAVTDNDFGPRNDLHIEDAFKNMPLVRLEMMQRQDETNPILAYLLGQSYLRQNNKTEAIKFLQLAVNLGCHKSELLNKLLEEDKPAEIKRWNDQLLENLDLEFESYMKIPLEESAGHRKKQLLALFAALPPELHERKDGIVCKMRQVFSSLRK